MKFYFGQNFIFLAKDFFHKMHNPKRCVWVEISRKYHLIFTSNCLCSFFPSVFIVLCTFLSSSRDAQIFIIFFYVQNSHCLKKNHKSYKTKNYFFGFSLREERKAEENVVKVSLSLHEFSSFFLLSREILSVVFKIHKTK